MIECVMCHKPIGEHDGSMTYARRDGLVHTKCLFDRIDELEVIARAAGTYQCPACAEDASFDPDGIHSGCSFECECGQKVVIEPVTVQGRDASYAALELQLDADPDALRKLMRYAPDAGLTEAEYDAMFRLLDGLERPAKGGG